MSNGLSSEKMVIDPGAINDAIIAIKQERDKALEAMAQINNEYKILSAEMGSDTLKAASEFQITADQLFERTNETLNDLERISVNYGAEAGHIDSGTATGIGNI